jgi:superfamily II DNA/RNA helicase
MDPPNALVFCATRNAVRHLEAILRERGFAAVALSGELSQSERNHALQALRDGRARVCVATDVAARGLDLPDVGIIVQADLPQNAEVFQHRSGRTGRAGRKGVSVLLVPGGSQRSAELMLRKAGARASWLPVPSADEIHVRDHARLVSELETLSQAPAEEDLAVARELLAKRSAEHLAAALVAIRRQGLPAPEDLPLSLQVVEGSKGKGLRPPGTRVATHPSARGGGSFSEPAASPHPSAQAARSHSAHPAHGKSRSAESTTAAKSHAAEPHVAKPHAESPAPAAKSHSADPSPAAKSHPAHAAKPAAAKHAPAHKPARESGPPESPWARPERPAEKPKRSHAEFGDSIWFTVDVGRGRNADPRWLLPLICRRGSVVKSQIGKIQILPTETRFQIVANAAQEFEKSARKPDAKDPSVHIKRVK